MKKHTYRTILIWAVLALAVVYIVPTVGWMTLSPEQRQARLEKWNQEDQTLHQRSYWGDLGRSIKRWAEFDRSKVINLGLDLQGGIHMVVGFDMKDLPPQMKEAGYTAAKVQQMILQRIWRRVNDFEAKEPVIQALGTNQVQIQLPGEKDVDRARRLIMRTAFMTFNMASGPQETNEVVSKIQDFSKGNFTQYLKAPSMVGGGFWRVPKSNFNYVRGITQQAEKAGIVPKDKEIAFSPAPNAFDEEQMYTMYLIDKTPAMTGEGLQLAAARPDNENPPYWMVLFEFGSTAANKFADVTENNIGRQMAIVVDGVVVSAPTIQSRIFGSGRITGHFTGEQAEDLAIALNSGSMPVPIREEYSGVVGATLGRDSIRYGVHSAIAGFICVVLFMLVYYRLAGIIAVVALFANALLVLGAFAYFNLTLTLPGIAGLVLTLGMAVDANVLIYERLREELRNGRTVVASLESGFNRATITILDANITTLIAALVLMQFGTGPVEGFAIALSVGVCTSVFAALLISRAMFDFMTGRWKFDTLSMMSFVKPGIHIRFMDRRRIAYAFSIISIAVTMTFFFIRGEQNFGVDFTTGTNMIFKLNSDQPVGVGEVRQQLADAGFEAPIVQVYESPTDTSPNHFVARFGQKLITNPDGTTTVADSTQIENEVAKALAKLSSTPDDPKKAVDIASATTVGPAVGKELRYDAFRAIGYALLLIVLYLWIRFELKFAVGAVIALVHDVCFTLGLLAVTGYQIDMTVVAALLTIVGYSLNDTIVVYDRIREDLQVYRGKGYSLAQIMDLSVNQTLSRTILTSLTTLIVVFILYLFGGAVIRPFAFSLLAGIVVGTYSSIYVASPVVLLLQHLRGQRALPMGSSGGSDETRGRYISKKNAKSSKEAPAQ